MHPVAHRSILQPLREQPGLTGLDPRRKQARQTGAAVLEWVRVEGDLGSRGAFLIDEIEEGLRTLSPVVAARTGEVRDLQRQPRTRADVDRLAERVEVAVAEAVPNVGVIDPTRAGDFRASSTSSSVSAYAPGG